MNFYTTLELRQLFLSFFANKNYSIIAGSSLVPQGDKSVLYTTAGMHPLIPYLSGELQHPAGKHLVNIQKVVRTGAIDRVGEGSYFTFFELLGNWDLGDYRKENVLRNAWEFLTDKKYLHILPSQLYITVFGGSEDMPADTYSHECWKSIGVDDGHIFSLGENWKGPYGTIGLSGPNTKIFYDTGKCKCGNECKPSCGCGKYIELWDIVFLEYKKVGESYMELPQKNVDTGMGLERIAALVQGVNSVYETDLFALLTSFIESKSNNSNAGLDDFIRSVRIIADHIRCAVFILGDEVQTTPSSNGRGYVLRKIIRRAIQKSDIIGVSEGDIIKIAVKVINVYKDIYPTLCEKEEFICNELQKEIEKYRFALKTAKDKFEQLVSGRTEIKYIELENMYKTFGLPIDYTTQILRMRGVKII